MRQNDKLHSNRDECEKFFELAARKWADDEPWTEEDSAFYSRHKESCGECAAFDDALSDLSTDNISKTEDSPDASSREDLIKKTVSRRFTAMRRRRYLAVGIAASLVLGAAVVLTPATKNDNETNIDETFLLSRGSITAAAERTIAAGERFSIEKGAAKADADTLIEIPGALYAALEKDARIGKAVRSGADVRLTLEQGRLAAHLIPGSGLGVQVETPNGIVDVKGTVFIVEARDSVDEVRVVRGSVSVKPKDAKQKNARTVNAGQAFSFEQKKHAALPPREEDPLLKLLGISAPPVKTSPPPASAADDVDTAEKNTAPEKKTAVQRPAPEVLLQAARRCRAAKNWKCAVDNYGKVVNYYPGLPDAATAMIPIAQILLENLHRPKEALQYFKRYQKRRPRGGLGREALFGECRALKQIGRVKAEKECLTRYLEKYPNTVYTQMAKSRLMSIMAQD